VCLQLSTDLPSVSQQSSLSKAELVSQQTDLHPQTVKIFKKKEKRKKGNSIFFD
jgi:hypothetical protein